MFSPKNERKKVIDSVGCQVIIGLETPVTLTTIRQSLFNSTKGVCTGLMPENGGAMMQLEGCVPYKEEDAEKYNHLRWWAGRTFGDLLDRAADIYPDKKALVDQDMRYTYAQVRNRVDRLAVSLMDLNIKPLDRAMVQLPNWSEFVIAYFALEKIGAIPILLNPRYREYEINYIARLTAASSWILPQKYRRIDFHPVTKAVLKDNPQMKSVILVRGKESEGTLNLEILIQEGTISDRNMERLARRRPDPMEVAHMGPTGGTTGLPKVVPRTHNDYLCRVEYAARAWELTSDDTLLIVAPVTHDLSFSQGLCSIIYTFGKAVMLDATDAESICRTIEEEEITAIAWVPTLASRVSRYERLKDFNLGSLKKMYCGGGICSPDLVREVSERLDCHVLNGYGGTEGMSTLPRMHYTLDRKCLTVGRPTCPYDTYRILDPEGRECPPNKPGELTVKGPGAFTGYYKAPEENRQVFDKEGYFRTGDQAMVDDAGDIVLTGRIKDIIVRGGENISPVEIENLLMTHPDVMAVAIVGMPDPVMGERACAYIQARGGKEIGLEEINAYLKNRGASVLQCPERVESVDAMPLTGAKGLINKKALREDIKKKKEEENYG
jgi:2,3-dihydroxybenzoate-AMP ligase/mycobactin salicyl-AMP ligase